MNKESIVSRDFIFGWIGLFCISATMYMLNTTITEYATLFGATAVLAGLVSGIYTFGGLVSRFFGGRLLNVNGWKRITLIFAALQIVACFLYFIVNNLTLLIIIRLIHGLCFGTTASGIITIGTANLPKAKYGVGMGTFMLATTIATGVGPYAGSLVIDNFGANGGFVMAAVLSIVIFIFIAAAKAPLDPAKSKERLAAERDKAQKEKEALAASEYKGIWKYIEKGAIAISFCNLLFAFAYAGVSSFVRLWAADEGLAWIVAYFFIAQMVVQLVCQPLFGRIQDRTHSDNGVMVVGIVAQIVGVGSMFFYPCVATLFAGAVGTAMGYNTLKSVTQAIATRKVTPERRSQGVSTFWIFTDFGMFLGPTVLGLCEAFGGYGYIFLGSAIVTLITLPVYYAVWGARRGRNFSGDDNTAVDTVDDKTKDDDA